MRRAPRIAAAAACVLAMTLSGCTSDSHDANRQPGSTSDAAQPGGAIPGGEHTGTGDADPTTTHDDVPGAAGVGEVGGSACGTPHGPYTGSEGSPSGSITVAVPHLATSLNGASGHGHTPRNLNPLYVMNGPGLFYYNDENELVNNDSLGTCTIDSLDPLTITYRLNPDATWSDGVPVSAADIVLGWAAGSGLFTVPAAAGTGDPPGAAVAFDSTNPGAQLITTFPTISDDGKAATFTYSKYFADYHIALGIGVPAHVVAVHAFDEDDPVQATERMMNLLAATIGAGDGDGAAASASATEQEQLRNVIDFWNTGFDATSMPKDPALAVSYGPYELTDWADGQYMTLRARSDHTWGPQPALQTIRLVFAPDPVAAVESLESGSLDIINPQATPDVMTALAGVLGDEVQAEVSGGAAYEHLDLVFDNGGPFDPASYGGNKDAALAVRRAFLLTVPRGEMVDTLIRPLNPAATVRNSFTMVPGKSGYGEQVAVNGSDFYDDAGSDAAIAEAKQLLADAGADTQITVRLLYADDDPRRAKEYRLIAESAAKAGFDVVDGVNDQWLALLGDNSLYDAALFAWREQSTGVAELAPNFQCATDGTDWGANNFGHYCNAAVNAALADVIHQPETEQRHEDIATIESALWADGFGLPLYQLPAVVAYRPAAVTSVSTMPLSPTYFWNFWQWAPSDQ